jgi:hypothetical protein
MLFIYILKVFLFCLLVLKKGFSIFLPDSCLLGVNLFLVDFFLSLFLNLSCKILSHLSFLLFCYFSASLLLFFFLSQLIIDMTHHLLVLGSDLLFLILDHRISKRCHYSFDLLFSLFFLLFSLLLEFIL